MSEDRWRIALEGHDFDLQEVKALLEQEGWTVSKSEKDGWNLAGPGFASCNAAGEVQAEAERVLDRVNAILSLSRSDYRSVQVGTTVSNGKGKTVALMSGHMQMRTKVSATVTRANGTVEKIVPYERERQWLNAAQNDANVAAVLDLLTSEKDNKLYRAFERIRKDLGGQDEVPKFMGWSSSKFRKFTAALNEPRHEHAVPASMSYDEAVALARRLIKEWLDSKTIEHS